MAFTAKEDVYKRQLSPTGHSSVAGDYMNLLTYSTLFRLDMEMNPQPHLVEEYEAVNDTLWRFKLREGVQFHDGTTLTARDVKASLDWAKSFPQVLSLIHIFPPASARKWAPTASRSGASTASTSSKSRKWWWSASRKRAWSGLTNCGIIRWSF